METTKEKTVSSANPPAGLVGDLQRLKVNGAATVAEIREFLATTKGRSPQEVLGMVAASSLLWSTLTASLIVLVIMVVFTAGPYFSSKMFPPSAAKPVKPAEAAKAAPQAAAAKPAEPAAAAADAKPGKPAKDKVLQALDMDAAKPADPKKNPLEKDKELEGLLDKID